MPFVLVAAALAQAVTPVPLSEAQSVSAQLAELYDEICLRTFPDDAAVDALMAQKGATPLPPDEVKATLRDDPGRGWRLAATNGRRILVFIELPPFNACSVRGGIGTAPADLIAYRRVTDAFKATRPGFVAQKPVDMTMGSMRIRATQEARPLGNGHETLLVIAQQLTDRDRIAKGENGTELRFVHQIVGNN